MNITLVYGNEPYLLLRYKNKVKTQVKEPDFNYMEAESWDSHCQDFVSSYPIMEDKKVLVIRNSSLEAAVPGDFFTGIRQMGTADLYLIVDTVDKRKQVYKQLKKQNIPISRQDKSNEILQTMIGSYLKQEGCRITRDAYEEFCQRIHYQKEEVNLFTVLQALKTLSCVRDITADDVKKRIPENKEKQIFKVAEFICTGKYKEAFSQADIILGSSENEAILFLSLLLRTFRIQYKLLSGLTKKELSIPGMTYIPHHVPAAQACACMDVIQSAIRAIKTGGKAKITVKTCLGQLVQTLQNEDRRKL